MHIKNNFQKIRTNIWSKLDIQLYIQTGFWIRNHIALDFEPSRVDSIKYKIFRDLDLELHDKK
jgi:hypothetical protein